MGLHEDGHLAAKAARSIGDPADVEDAVDGPVGKLGGKLVIQQVQRGERQSVEFGRRRVSKIHRQPVAQARCPEPRSRSCVVPAEECSEL